MKNNSLHKVGEYWFDSESLLFYPTKYSLSQIDLFRKEVGKKDSIEETLDIFKKYDADHMTFPVHAMNEAGICLTYNCNLRCSYCSDMSCEGFCDNLTSGDVTAYIKEIAKYWTISQFAEKKKQSLKVYFTGGGEPTYNWNLFVSSVEEIKMFCKNNMIPLRLGITTNGMLNCQQLEFISSNFNTVMVSYDGMPEVQNANRRSSNGKESNDVVTRSIEYFTKCSNIELNIRTTLCPSDIPKLRDMADYLFQNFIPAFEWSIRPIIPLGRALEIDDREKAFIGKNDFLKYYLDLCCYTKEKYNYERISNSVFPNDINSFSCGAVSFSCPCLWLLPDKRIITCIESSSTVTEIGEIKDKKFTYHKEYVDPIMKMCYQRLVECQGCIASRFCRGGCPIRYIEEEKSNTNLNKWECEQIQQYWKLLLGKVTNHETWMGWKTEEMKGLLSEKGILKLVKESRI